LPAKFFRLGDYFELGEGLAIVSERLARAWASTASEAEASHEFLREAESEPVELPVCVR
jgi:hypothetical protein